MNTTSSPQTVKVFDKTLKGIRGERIDNRKVFSRTRS